MTQRPLRSPAGHCPAPQVHPGAGSQRSRPGLVGGAPAVVGLKQTIDCSLADATHLVPARQFKAPLRPASPIAFVRPAGCTAARSCCRPTKLTNGRAPKRPRVSEALDQIIRNCRGREAGPRGARRRPRPDERVGGERKANLICAPQFRPRAGAAMGLNKRARRRPTFSLSSALARPGPARPPGAEWRAHAKWLVGARSLQNAPQPSRLARINCKLKPLARALKAREIRLMGAPAAKWNAQ